MNTDIELLRRYVEAGSEEAFAELVRRHIDFVYAAALRQAPGAHRAEDVVQAVFTDLARKARTLCGRSELVGWLYVSTRYAALTLVRREARRDAREKEAHMIHELTGDGGANIDWAALRPVLDEALHDLAETDRIAILRRFFRNESFATIASALNMSEEAARKRVDRALDKLHALLAGRGVTSTASALAVALTHQPIIAAPAGLAAAVASSALTGVPAGAGAATATVMVGLMSTSKIILGAAGIIIALAAGMALIERHRAESTRATVPRSPGELERVTTKRDTSRVRSDQAKPENTDAKTEKATKSQAIATVAPSAAEQVKAMEGNLRRIAEARVQFQLENGRWPATLADLVGPDKQIKDMPSVAGEDYSAVSLTGHFLQPLQVVSPTGIVVNYDPGRDRRVVGGASDGPVPPAEALMRRSSDLHRRLDPAVTSKAAKAYRAAHDGQVAPNPRALVGYFESAKDGADWLEYVETREAALRMLESEAQAAARPK